jgi:hypothetical protein
LFQFNIPISSASINGREKLPKLAGVMGATAEGVGFTEFISRRHARGHPFATSASQSMHGKPFEGALQPQPKKVGRGDWLNQEKGIKPCGAVAAQ